MTEQNDKLFIGIDLGGTTIKGALVDDAGNIVYETRVDTEKNDSEKLLAQIIEFTKHLQQQSESRAATIGIGVPGLVNIKTNRIETMPNLPNLSEIDIPGRLSEATKLPVTIDNDANAAAYAELKAGAARDKKDVFFVTLGTGVGAGLIMDGKIYRGATGFAGEFGHMTIDPEGIECGCGNVGCLETIASAPNIVRRMRARLQRDRTSSLSLLAIPRDREMTAEDIGVAAQNGDEMAQLIMERTGMFLGIAIAAVVNLLNVEMVVLGGGVMAAGNLILKPTTSETRRRAFPPSFNNCEIVLAELGAAAGVIGAALIGRDYAK
ncbi:MAG: ROK family protein [Acidobacteriota bacterium]